MIVDLAIAIAGCIVAACLMFALWLSVRPDPVVARYRLSHRLTVPVVVADIVRTHAIQITRSRCHTSDRYEHKDNTNRTSEVRSVEHGVRIQIGHYSASWIVRVNKSIVAHEATSTEYAVAQ